MTSHLDDGIIEELIDGEIPSISLPPLREHLVTCADCRARLEAARRSVAESDELIKALDAPRPVPVGRTSVVEPTAGRSREWLRRGAWAASLVVAVGAGYLARGAPTPVGAPRVAETISPPPASGPPPAAAVSVAVPESTAVATSTPAVATRSRESPRRDVAPALDGASGKVAAAPVPSTAADTPPQQDRAVALPTDRVGNVLALQPGVMASPGGAGAEARTTSTSEAPFQLRLRSESSARDLATNKAVVTDTILFTDAVQRLGGRLLLIEGMVPTRLEAAGGEVRVVYRVRGGELILIQSIASGVVSHRLIAPPGFPADSVRALERRIKG